jgi:hypothetical protein
MALIDFLVVEVGPAVAKVILKFWLKDANLALDISSSLVDLLKKKTSDVLAQRRGQRQFEDIGERVAESLLPVFEVEGATLDDGGRTAVVVAVSKCLSAAQIDAQLLAETNLEPTKLVNYLKRYEPQDLNHFSEIEVALYHRVIWDISQSIVGIASQLQGFSERTLSEVLKREDELLRIATRILDEVRRIREASWKANPEIEAAQFERDYRQAVVRNLDEMELLGVNLPNRRYRLSVAYITLVLREYMNPLRKTVDEEAPGEPSIEYIHSGPFGSLIAATELVSEITSGTRRSRKLDVTRWNGESTPGRSRFDVSAEKMLAKTRRLIVRGAPGSGKSTLLQWIAVHSASRDFTQPLEEWNNTIPFFIRLREYARAPLPAVEEFPSSVAKAIAGRMPLQWIHRQLEVGRGVVLIDGVDELPYTRRTEVRAWIKDISDSYPASRLIVTSRPSAIGEGWLGREGFDEAELQPMQQRDIHAFIDQWHEAVGEEIRPEDKTNLEQLAEELKEIVDERRPIRGLATNPLLCALLCALHRIRGKALPTGRLELYEKSCEMLIQLRDLATGVDLSDYPQLSYEQKLLLLRDLAYWMLKNHWPEVEKEEAQKRIQVKLANIVGLPSEATPQRVISLLTDRTGVLQEPIVGQLDFAHRTFQEFLAAQSALDEQDTGILVQHAHDDQWREVIVLAAGLARPKVRSRLLGDLIARGDWERRDRRKIHTVAVACLETSVEVDSRVKRDLEKRLRKLAPPRNMEDARTLAAAGETIITHLANTRWQNVETAAACVRTLALISGQAALDVIKTYLNDSRLEVAAELYRSREHFHSDNYEKSVLSQMQVVRIPQIRARDEIKSLENLTTLFIDDIEGATDLRSLADMTQIERLVLGGCEKLIDLSTLAHFTQLTQLVLCGCERLTDLNPLTNLTQLKQLDLSECYRLTDLSPLGGLTQLEWLGLEGGVQLTNIVPLGGLKRLKALDLSSATRLTDLRPIASLTELTHAYLAGCSAIIDVSPLWSIPNLEYYFSSHWVRSTNRYNKWVYLHDAKYFVRL